MTGTSFGPKTSRFTIGIGLCCHSHPTWSVTTLDGLAFHVIPVQARGEKDMLSRVQIEQDIGLCANRLPFLICRPVGAQPMRDTLIVLFEFERASDRVRVVSEKQYQLLPPDGVTAEDLIAYRQRLADW